MPTLTNSFEGITPSGTTVTTANSGATSGTAFDGVNIGTGGTVASDSAHSAHGSLGCQFATGATAATTYCTWSTSLGTQSQVWFRVYAYLTANPAATIQLWSAFNVGTACGSLRVNTTGKLVFYALGSTVVLTSTNSIPLNQWFRVEGFLVGSATVGQEEFKLFSSMDSSTAAETQTSAATLNTFGSVTVTRFGNGLSLANVGPFWEDDVGVSTTGYLGPAAPPAGATPYLAGHVSSPAASGVTTATVTHATAAGDAIIVCANTPPSSGNNPVSVSDTKNNTYTPAGLISSTGVFVSTGGTPLALTDTVTVGWSTTASNAKNVIVIGAPGVATVSAIDPAGATSSGTGAAVSVSSGTPATSGETAILAVGNGNGGGTPTGLGSFTSLDTEQNGATQYLTAAYQQLPTATSVTGSATITGTTNAWGAVLVLLSPSPLSTAARGLVGAYISAGVFSGGTASGITQWQNITARPAKVRRVYYGTSTGGNPLPATIGTDLQADAAAGRKVCISFQPAIDGSEATQVGNFLQSCFNAGLTADVSIYHEQSFGSTRLTATQYKNAITSYAPVIRQYFPLVFCSSSYYYVHNNGISYYPGDALIDKIAWDWYCSEWNNGNGITLDTIAALADSANPPKPLGLWEFNSSTDPTQGQTQTVATKYWTYILNFFSARLTAGKANADLLVFNSNSVLSQETQISSASDYRVPLWQALYDGLSGQAAPPVNVSLAAVLNVSAQATPSLAVASPGAYGSTYDPTYPATVTSGPPVVTPPPPSPAVVRTGFPTVTTELGLLPAAPVQPLGTFIIGTSQLGVASLGAADIWTDISGFARSGAISRPATRLSGPLWQYQAGTLSAVLKDADGRFDPDNLTGPYTATAAGTTVTASSDGYTGGYIATYGSPASGGSTAGTGGVVSLIRPMIPVRVRAFWNNTEYRLFRGFADAWQTPDTNWGPRYAETTVTASDALKVLEGLNLATTAVTFGSGDTSGQRISRILDAAGWSANDRQIDPGDSVVQPTTYGDTALNLAYLTSDTEIGELYVNGGGQIVFRHRQALLEDARSRFPQAVFGDRPGPAVVLNANTSFETGTAPWAATGGATVTQSTAFAYDGTHSALITPDGNTTGPGMISETLPVDPLGNYAASAQILIPTGWSNAQIQLTWKNSSGTVVGTSTAAVDVAATSTTWTPLFIGGQAVPAGAVTVALTVSLTGIPGAATLAYADAAQLYTQAELPYSGAGRANDDTQLTNDVQITAAGSVNLQEATDAASVVQFLFVRSYARTDLLMTSDAEALEYAYYILYLAKGGSNRFDTLTLNPLRDPANLFPHVLGRDFGDRIQIWRRPPGMTTPIVKDLFIRGIDHAFDIGHTEWDTTWTLEDASRYSFLLIGDTKTGVIGSSALAY